MQVKLFVCGLFVSLFIANVLAIDVDGDGDDDDNLDDTQAKLIEAAETLIKNLNARDATDLARRSWFKNIWNKYLKPAVKTAAQLYINNVLQGKRALDVNEALNVQARGSGPDCANDAARLNEIKKAAAELCDLTKIPDVQCD